MIHILATALPSEILAQNERSKIPTLNSTRAPRRLGRKPEAKQQQSEVTSRLVHWINMGYIVNRNDLARNSKQKLQYITDKSPENPRRTFDKATKRTNQENEGPRRSEGSSPYPRKTKR